MESPDIIHSGFLATEIMATKIREEETQPKDAVLTQNDEKFCQLYVCGGVEYAGQLSKCYKEVFGEDYRDVLLQARQYVRQPHLAARIKELIIPMTSETEVMAIKMQITETLRAVMEEASTNNFRDKYGNPLSPAPLRAVSVNAAKALMELYPVKHAHETKLRIEGSDGGVVFNVIVPEIRQDNDPEE